LPLYMNVSNGASHTEVAMILKLDGEVLDSSVEQEIVRPEGMSVFLTFVDGSEGLLLDMTEVHHLYDDPCSRVIGESIAVESDILRDGCTYRVHNLVSVKIFTKKGN
jgi:hypothetical protein